jgi:hypothetical protein
VNPTLPSANPLPCASHNPLAKPRVFAFYREVIAEIAHTSLLSNFQKGVCIKSPNASSGYHLGLQHPSHHVTCLLSFGAFQGDYPWWANFEELILQIVQTRNILIRSGHDVVRRTTIVAPEKVL